MALVSHKWEPVADLPADRASLDDGGVTALMAVWHEQLGRLDESHAYQDFDLKLRRELAIETGAIEGIYHLSPGATRTLIAQGLNAALITHDDTDQQSPELVVARIQDQYDAVQGVYQYVASQRPLSKSFIRELHQTVTRHQPSYAARDSLGTLVERQLTGGEWKRFPNNVEHDGAVFEFCPAVQVESEIDRMLALHADHMAEGVSPLVEAAWLHHAFSLIHPFPDGNGRIARCLATMILTKARWMPLVVTRAHRDVYLAALRKADQGDLSHLVRFFGELQRTAIRRALSLGEQTLQQRADVDGILETIRTKITRQREADEQPSRRVFLFADALQHMCQERFGEVASRIRETLAPVEPSCKVFVTGAAHDRPNAHYYQHQVVEAAGQLGYFANVTRYRSWAALTVAMSGTRIYLLVSLHELGRQPSGVMVASALMFAKRAGEDEHELELGGIHPLSEGPFEFTYKEDAESVKKRFAGWLEQCIATGLDRWRNEVG